MIADEQGFREAWRRAALAAAATTTSEGAIALEVVTPLVQGHDPVLALPYSRTALAHDLRDGGQVVLVCWDSRLAEVGWTPLAARVTVTVGEDRAGAWIEDGLLQQELQLHPPSRELLDTPLLRREHWWYVPRWIVRITGVLEVWPVARRDGPLTGVLAWDDVDGLRADVVEVDDWAADPVAVRSVGGADLAHALGPAALLASDVRTPNLDHTAELRAQGYLRGSAVQVDAREGAPVLGPPPTLWRRLKEARQLHRACRRQIAAPPT